VVSNADSKNESERNSKGGWTILRPWRLFGWHSARDGDNQVVMGSALSFYDGFLLATLRLFRIYNLW